MNRLLSTPPASFRNPGVPSSDESDLPTAHQHQVLPAAYRQPVGAAPTTAGAPAVRAPEPPVPGHRRRRVRQDHPARPVAAGADHRRRDRGLDGAVPGRQPAGELLPGPHWCAAAGRGAAGGKPVAAERGGWQRGHAHDVVAADQHPGQGQRRVLPDARRSPAGARSAHHPVAARVDRRRSAQPAHRPRFAADAGVAAWPSARDGRTVRSGRCRTGLRFPRVLRLPQDSSG
ncbi:hypothetical protein D3C76_627200 [compost metagenome]